MEYLLPHRREANRTKYARIYKENPGQVVQDARTKVEAIDYLAWHWHEGVDLAHILSLGILDLFFDHLKKSDPVPVGSAKSRLPPHIFGFKSFFGICLIPTHFVPNTNLALLQHNEEIVQFTDEDCQRALDQLAKYHDVIIRGIPSLLKWSKPFINMPDTSKSASQLNQAWCSLLRMPIVGPTISKMPAVVGLVSRLWLRELKSYQLTLRDDPSGLCASRLMNEIARQHIPSMGDLIKDNCGMPLDQAAKLALSRVRLATVHPELFLMQTLVMDFKVLYSLSLSDDPIERARWEGEISLGISVFHREMLVQKSLQLYIKALTMLPPLLEKFPYNTNIRTVCGYASHLICHFASRGNGFTLLSKTIRAGLIQAYVSLSQYVHPGIPLEDKVLESMGVFLSAALPFSLIYLPVLTATIAAVDKLSREDTRIAREGCLGKDWAVLKAVLADRRRDWEDFIKTRLGTTLHTHCCNRQCAKKNVDKTFRQCSGCGKVVYCSSSCQKVDWKSGHRQACLKEQENDRTGEYSHPNMKEFAFMMHVGHRTFFSELQSLRAQARRDFPHLSGKDLAVQIDLVCYPPKASLTTIAEVEDIERNCQGAMTSLELRLQDIQSAKESNGQAVILIIRFFMGRYIQCLFNSFSKASCEVCQERGIVSLLDGDCMGWKTEEMAREDGTLIVDKTGMYVQRELSTSSELREILIEPLD